MKINNVECLMFNVKLNSKFKIQNSKLLRSGFTMIELIFVIVLMGILVGIGTSFIPNNHLRNDTNFLLLQIKNQQKNAIGYDVADFSHAWSEPEANSSDYNRTCIEFDKAWLEARDKDSTHPYKFDPKTTITADKDHICFDNLGRAYLNAQLLNSVTKITLTYPNKPKKVILIYPLSGYDIINRQ